MKRIISIAVIIPGIVSVTVSNWKRRDQFVNAWLRHTPRSCGSHISSRCRPLSSLCEVQLQRRCGLHERGALESVSLCRAGSVGAWESGGLQSSQTSGGYSSPPPPTPRLSAAVSAGAAPYRQSVFTLTPETPRQKQLSSCCCCLFLHYPQLVFTSQLISSLDSTTPLVGVRCCVFTFCLYLGCSILI